MSRELLQFVAAIGMGSVMMILFCGYSLGVWYGATLIIEKGYTGAQVINAIFAVLTQYPLSEREGMFHNLQRLMPGGVVLAIRHHREFFLEGIVVERSRLPCGIVRFACNSWLRTTGELPGNSKWVFF